MVVGVFANTIARADGLRAIEFAVQAPSSSVLLWHYDAGQNLLSETALLGVAAISNDGGQTPKIGVEWANTPPIAGLAAKDSAGDGLIYFRTDAETGEQYVGQTQSLSSFMARQAEHAAANPDADFDYEVLSSGLSKSQLDQYEQFWINVYGGPSPAGELANLRNQMTYARYLAAGGDPLEELQVTP
jgi:hypothetical protein